MSDAIDLLMSDHRAVEALFTRVEGKPSPDEKTVHEIVKELSIHDAIEKEYLYPTVRDKATDGDRLADRSVEEHSAVAETLLAIDKASPGSKEQAQLLIQLMGLVKSHVQEEEEIIFPAMKANMSAPELKELGEKLAQAKELAPTRPHPHAPSEGLGTKVAGAMAAPLDKARDAASGRS